jgi:hypothetical protein
MDAQHFDDHIRSFAATTPRRGLLGGLASGLLALLTPISIGEVASAKNKNKNKKRKRRKNKRKKKDRCTKIGNPCTPDGRKCCPELRCDTSIDTFASGQTVCCASTEGAGCTDNSGCCAPLLCSTATNTCFFRS